MFCACTFFSGATVGVPAVIMNSDHWKLKVHEGFLAGQAEDGSLLPGALRVFNPPSVDGRQNRTAHLSFAKHILAETWETRFVPGFKGNRTGWWKSPSSLLICSTGCYITRM